MAWRRSRDIQTCSAFRDPSTPAHVNRLAHLLVLCGRWAVPTPLAAFSPTAFPTIAPTGRLPVDSNPANACPGDDDSSYMVSNMFCQQRDLDQELTFNSSFCGLGYARGSTAPGYFCMPCWACGARVGLQSRLPATGSCTDGITCPAALQLASTTTVPLTVTPAAATDQALATAAPGSTPRGGESEGSGGQGGAGGPSDVGGTSDFGGNAADTTDATAESEFDSSNTGDVTGTGTEFGGSPAPLATTEGPTCTVGPRATSVATASPSSNPICASAAAAAAEMQLEAIWVVLLVAVVVLIAGWGTLVLRRRRSANSQARDLFKEKSRVTSRKSRKSRAASRHWDSPSSPGAYGDGRDVSGGGPSASNATPTSKYQGSSAPNPTFDSNAVTNHIAQPVQYQIPMATGASASPSYATALDPAADDNGEGGSGYIQVEAFARGPGGPTAPVISTAPLTMYRVLGVTAHAQVATAGPNVYDQRSSEPQQQAAGASGSYSVLTRTTSLRDESLAPATTHVYDQRVADGLSHAGAVPRSYSTLPSRGAHPTKTTGSGVTVYDVRRGKTPESDLPPVSPNSYAVLAPQLRAAPAAAGRYASLERNASVPILVDYPAVHARAGGAIATVNPEASTTTTA